jgi:hypothetical protein
LFPKMPASKTTDIKRLCRQIAPASLLVHGNQTDRK